MNDNLEISLLLENLEKLEVELLNFEESINSGIADSSFIHRIFRHAHNLKSMLAMSDKEHSSKLMHVLESCFDALRKGDRLSSELIVQNSLLSVDIIRSNIDTKDENIIDIESQINIFERIISEESSAKTKKETIKIPLEIQQKNKKVFDEPSNKYYLIEKLIKSDIDKETMGSLPIYADIREVGFLIHQFPRFEDIDKSSEFFVLTLIFSSEKNKEELEYFIFDPFREVAVSFENEVKKNVVKIPRDIHSLRTLVVEDEFFSRVLLQEILLDFGKCDVAVNGIEAVEAVKMRVLQGNPYDLICLDIMMPEMDGHETLKRIRAIEEENGILGLDRAKIIMTTALDDMETVISSFRDQCDVYLVKPISVNKLKNELYKLNLITKSNESK